MDPLTWAAVGKFVKDHWKAFGVTLVALAVMCYIGWLRLEVDHYRTDAADARTALDTIKNRTKAEEQKGSDAKSQSETEHVTNLKAVSDSWSAYADWLRKHPANRVTCSVPAASISTGQTGQQPDGPGTVAITEEQITAIIQQGDQCRATLNDAKSWARQLCAADPQCAPSIPQ